MVQYARVHVVKGFETNGWYTSISVFAEQELTLSYRVHLSSVWQVLEICTKTPPGTKGGSQVHNCSPEKSKYLVFDI
jgi:hypothetical protein